MQEIASFVGTHARRRAPRVGVDAVCWEDGVRQAMVVDLSAEGLKIERPFVLFSAGAADRRRIQLEIEMPEIDDVIWVGGEICFDRRHGLVQSTGVRLVAGAARDLRRIRDFVFERGRALAANDPDYGILAASCYLRG